jgi:hypothetical protein
MPPPTSAWYLRAILSYHEDTLAALGLHEQAYLEDDVVSGCGEVLLAQKFVVLGDVLEAVEEDCREHYGHRSSPESPRPQDAEGP